MATSGIQRDVVVITTMGTRFFAGVFFGFAKGSHRMLPHILTIVILLLRVNAHRSDQVSSRDLT